MYRSLSQFPRILAKSLVILLAIWVERHGNLPFLGRIRWIMGFSPEIYGETPLATNVVLLVWLGLGLAGTLFIVRHRHWGWLGTGGLLFATVVPILFWMPTGKNFWNVPLPGPPMLDWFLALFIYWAGLLYFFYHPDRGRFPSWKTRFIYLGLAWITPFLSLDRFVLSLVVAAFLPSIIQQLFPPKNSSYL